MLKSNVLEVSGILAVWAVMLGMHHWQVGPVTLTGVILLSCLIKTLLFGVENVRQLVHAARSNLPYHRFLLLMLINMGEIILSFGLDYHALHLVHPDSFGAPDLAPFEPATIFEFVYYSSLNFTFFGYGDMTPQTVPAKLLTMTEVILSFTTVLFLLSDFVSLRESIRTPEGQQSRRDEGERHT
jgi:hypothetical protein